EGFQKPDGGLVPTGGKPQNPAVAAMPVDRAVLAQAELDTAPVLDVGQPAPGRLPFALPLIARYAELRRALLELDGIAAGRDRPVDQLAGEAQRAVVVDADLRDEKRRLTRADFATADSDSTASLARGVTHPFTPFGCSLPPKLENESIENPRGGN